MATPTGTLQGAITRRYYGLLIAALPAPLGRVMLLNHLSERLRFNDRSVEWLSVYREQDRPAQTEGARSLVEFRLEDGVPVWRFAARDRRIEITGDAAFPPLRLAIHANAAFTVDESTRAASEDRGVLIVRRALAVGIVLTIASVLLKIGIGLPWRVRLGDDAALRLQPVIEVVPVPSPVRQVNRVCLGCDVFDRRPRVCARCRRVFVANRLGRGLIGHTFHRDSWCPCHCVTPVLSQHHRVRSMQVPGRLVRGPWLSAAPPDRQPTADQAAAKAKLEKLTGAQFDRACLDLMEQDHQKDIKELERQAAMGADPQLKVHLKLTMDAKRARRSSASVAASLARLVNLRKLRFRRAGDDVAGRREP